MFVITLSGCSTQKRYIDKEFDKMETCRKAWAYKELKESTQIKVLLFNKKFNYDISSFPNFIIGVTKDLDTIGIIDNAFVGTINKSENISVLPSHLTDIENAMTKPVFSVHKDSKTNNLYCSVKTVYYGQIMKK
jgi:hypothetical protein